VLDGNIYNLGLAKMFHYTTDPILIPQKQSDENSHQEFQAFVVGNLCREDDFLINRLINFTQEPQPGDLLIFTNTAAYFAGFEDASPIMHPTSKFLVVSKTEKDEWIISTPENYIPVNPVK
jgi:diaminopimelate decarboxylase